jgi:hypothetical protein
MFNAVYRRPKHWFIKIVLALLLGQWLVGPMIVARADEPQPDPAGIATGDRNTTFDAGGNSFAVTAPTDKTAPDYAKSKKAYDAQTLQVEVYVYAASRHFTSRRACC